ncbi:MAG: amidohydrolase family protein [Alphaproteobacteria bacterium]|nr:amidohydrolase family protein [Alphaproteobacteria bacterium]
MPGARRRLRFFAALFAALAGTWPGPSLAATVALLGATLIDDTGATPLANSAVLLDGDRIVAVGRVGEVAVPADAQRIDLAGKWLLPGLIDAHMHFFQSGGAFARPDILDLRSIRPYDAEVRAVRDAIPATFARYLASGITTVVDVGGPYWTFEVRALATRSVLAPNVFVAGPLLTPYLPPEIAVADPAMIAVATPDQARAEVRRLAAQRPDLVKIWFVRARPQMAWMSAVIEEAHALGLRVGVHATDVRLARAVVEAGADVLVHGMDDMVVDAALAFQLRAQGVVYTPTFAVVEGYARPRACLPSHGNGEPHRRSRCHRKHLATGAADRAAPRARATAGAAHRPGRRRQPAPPARRGRAHRRGIGCRQHRHAARAGPAPRVRADGAGGPHDHGGAGGRNQRRRRAGAQRSARRHRGG